jgi:hypothetical protein
MKIRRAAAKRLEKNLPLAALHGDLGIDAGNNPGRPQTMQETRPELAG